jgi:hypothetical protein
LLKPSIAIRLAATAAAAATAEDSVHWSRKVRRAASGNADLACETYSCMCPQYVSIVAAARVLSLVAAGSPLQLIYLRDWHTTEHHL